MLFQIDFKAGKPVYLQLVDQVRYAAASGMLRPGEPLPGIRPLAEELRVNRNTIAKAYTELDEAVVMAHHLQIDRDAFLEMIKERLDHFERLAAQDTESSKTTPRRTQ